MEPVFIIDASKAYGQGQEIYIVSDGTFGMYKVKFKSKGIVPAVLNGSYSSAKGARDVVLRYLDKRAAILEVKDRKDKVRESKEQHAIRKYAEQIAEA